MESTGTISFESTGGARVDPAPLLLRPRGFARPHATSRGLIAAIFVATTGLHVALVLRARGNEAPSAVARKRSQVEIQFTRPPPPPTPVIIPPQAAQPTAPKPAAVERRAPRISAPPPVLAAPAAPAEAAVAEAPPDPTGPADPLGDVGPSAPAPGPPVAAPPPPPPPVVEAKEGANYLANPRPPYPRIAIEEGWEGTVMLRVNVLPNGKPGVVTVQKSSGRKVLDNAAIAAVNGWTFVPASQGGSPIAGWVNVPINFRLQ